MKKSIFRLISRCSFVVALFLIASNLSAQIVKQPQGTRTSPNDISTFSWKSASQCLSILQVEIATTESQLNTAAAADPNSAVVKDLKLRYTYFEYVYEAIVGGSSISNAIETSASKLKTEDGATATTLKSFRTKAINLLKL
jgi:hypothetical protein